MEVSSYCVLRRSHCWRLGGCLFSLGCFFVWWGFVLFGFGEGRGGVPLRFFSGFETEKE